MVAEMLSAGRGEPAPVGGMTGPGYPLEPGSPVLMVTGLPVMGIPAPVGLTREGHFGH